MKNKKYKKFYELEIWQEGYVLQKEMFELTSTYPSDERFALPIIILNKIAAIAAVVMIQYAAAIGSVTLVFAMSGLQYALMFVMILLFTKFAPNIFQKYYTRKELILEWIAIALIVLGSGLTVL